MPQARTNRQVRPCFSNLIVQFSAIPASTQGFFQVMICNIQLSHLHAICAVRFHTLAVLMEMAIRIRMVSSTSPPQSPLQIGGSERGEQGVGNYAKSFCFPHMGSSKNNFSNVPDSI